MEIRELVNDYLDGANHNLKLKGIQLYKNLSKKFLIKELGNDGVEIKVLEANRQKSVVTISFNQEYGYAGFSCDCAFFESKRDCKHCVAAALYLLDHDKSFSKKNEPAIQKKVASPKKRNAP